MFKKSLEKIELFLFLILGVLFFISAFGVSKNIILMLGTAHAACLIGVQLILREIKIPRYFYLYLLSLAILSVNLMVLHKSEFFFWALLSGGLYWLAIYNAKDIFNKYFAKGLLVTGVVMALLFIFSILTGLIIGNKDSLFAQPSILLNHSNFGLLGAIIILTILKSKKRFKKRLEIITVFVLSVLLLLARSRTALVSLMGTLVYLDTKRNGKDRRLTTFIIAATALMFLYTAATKSTLASRPYFLESLFILFSNPLGIGMANLAKYGGSSNLTHNIILEFLVGAGIFSIPLIVWFGKEVYDKLKMKDGEEQYKAIFLAITISFMFDVTYVLIPFV